MKRLSIYQAMGLKVGDEVWITDKDSGTSFIPELIKEGVDGNTASQE